MWQTQCLTKLFTKPLSISSPISLWFIQINLLPYKQIFPYGFHIFITICFSCLFLYIFIWPFNTKADWSNQWSQSREKKLKIWFDINKLDIRKCCCWLRIIFCIYVTLVTTKYKKISHLYKNIFPSIYCLIKK